MSDELRAPLVDALRRLADDLLIGRHDDPHLGFVVLLHPDRHPSIVSLSPIGSGSYDFAKLRGGKDDPPETPDDGTERHSPFTWDDLDESAKAIAAAQSAGRSFQFRTDRTQTLGLHIDAAIAERWETKRFAIMEQEMERAAFEEAHPAQCGNCDRRFTEQGLKQHRSRSPYVGCRSADAPPLSRPRPRRSRVWCPLPTCPWTGLDDEVGYHMTTVHAGRYVVG